MELEQIKDIVKEVTQIDIDQNTRRREIVEARSIYFHLCKNNTNNSLTEIGRSVGKHHATVLHGINQLKDWTFYDTKIRKQLLEAEGKIVFFKQKVHETGLSFEQIVDRYRDLEDQNKHLIQANKTLMGKVVSLTSALKGCNYK